MARKSRSKDFIEKHFQKVRQAVVNNTNDKHEAVLRQLRTARLMLCHDFCEEVMGAVCLDSVRLELLQETDQLRKRAYLMPRDSMIFKLFPSENGEH